jgi:hypothetical protein
LRDTTAGCSIPLSQDTLYFKRVETKKGGHCRMNDSDPPF